MNAYREVPSEIEDQLALYFDNQATPQVVQAIGDWLAEDPANARVFAEYGTIERMIYCAQKTEDASAVFALLQEAEEKAHAQLVTLDAKPFVFHEKRHKTEDPITLQKAFAVLSYAGLKAARRHAWTITGLAAVLLLAVALAIVLNVGESDNTEPAVAVDDQDNGQPALVTTRIVATLTAEHDAVWDAGSAEGASSPGSQLRAGQRLTLAQGSAEITTHRGAIVMLQAPASIELLDHDNALHLHAGKLVGICERPSSKGFAVFTDTAKVTDIGTVFGIERDASGQTTVGVLSGHVVLSNKASTDEPRLLKAGDVAGVSADGLAMTDPFVDTAARLDAWASMVPQVVVTGDAVFVTRMPVELHQDHDLVRVYREPGGVVLKEDLIVSRTETGLYRPTDPNERSVVPAGTRVDSYFVHINRPNRPTSRVSKTFTIHFDQPVLALIVHTNLVIATNSQFGDPTTRYLKAGGIGLVSKSGFDLDAPQVDSIQWSDDRRTLRVTLHVEDYDQFRVLTLSPEAASADGLND